MPSLARQTAQRDPTHRGAGEAEGLHERRNRGWVKTLGSDRGAQASPHPQDLGEGDGPMSASNVSGDSFGEAIDLACDRFEAEWQAGARPQIQPYLAEV